IRFTDLGRFVVSALISTLMLATVYSGAGSNHGNGGPTRESDRATFSRPRSAQDTLMRIAVIGASGTIGRPLVEALSQTHEVVRVARRPPRDNRENWIAADATDAVAISSALEGIDVVYHLVHSLGSADFEERDRAAATAVAEGAASAGAKQVVYLGGLGEGSSDLSPHLRSRAETAEILAAGSVPVTALRAAM